MPKTCQHTGCAYKVWGKGFCKNHQWERTDRKPRKITVSKPIKPMSKKLSSERVIYRKLRIEFLARIENMFCAVYPDLRSDQVHHMRGRGKYLNDTSTWLAVSGEGHAWIEANPKLSKERGFTKSRLHLTDSINENE